MNDEQTKRCSKCGEVKPLGEFHRCSREATGVQYRCKQCTSDCNQEYRERLKNLACPAAGRNGTEFVLFVCEVCGTEFRVLKSDVDSRYKQRGKMPRFCSRTCYGISRRKGYGVRTLSPCNILLHHADILKNDPECLSTDFIKSLIGRVAEDRGGDA